MKKPWIDPVKKPASPETMNTPGNMKDFTEAMKTLIKARPQEKPKTASPGPVVS